MRFARRDASGNVYYYLTDGLGTTRGMLLNSNTTLCYDADFYPFGGEKVFTNTCAQNYKFTGLERDSESGLDKTVNRMYTSNLGRWLSPDRLGGRISNPQSLNRYGYVLNNPINLIDPVGLVAYCPYGQTNNECNRDPFIDEFFFNAYYNSSPPVVSGGSVNPDLFEFHHSRPSKWDKAQDKLDNANSLLQTLKPCAACQSDLNAILAATGRDLTDIQNKADKVALNDATTSTALERDLFPVGSQLYDFYSPTGMTIAQWFSINTNTKGETAFLGSALADNIFLVPSFVNGHSSGYNAANLMHEVLHTFGPDDSALQRALGCTGPSVCITDKLAEDCFGVTK